ncbi:hypothetical protein [Epilithonimonas vandammei]|uniref:hypothetical protein n=1 Tax=Epilithonimonas vandammei TaxID=2487072 RepID=UPI0028B22E1A|nr:hypothetical protein [Epilithonimonas vandammei]
MLFHYIAYHVTGHHIVGYGVWYFCLTSDLHGLGWYGLISPFSTILNGDGLHIKEVYYLYITN